MNNERQLLFVAALVALVAYGCAQSAPIDDFSGNAGASQVPPGFGGAMGAAGEPGTGSGGATAAGGDTGAAGVIGTGTGGKLGTGGTTMTGGTTGAGGGVTEKGGTTGAGGRATETGGSTGAGGATETGGSTGAAGSSGRGGGRGGITGAAGAGSGAGTGKGAGPTFTQVYSTILSVYCTGSSCHSPGTAGGLSFASKASAYSALQNYVTPGDDTQSDFYFAVSTGAMPKGKAKLSAANIATIKGWIDAGALDN